MWLVAVLFGLLQLRDVAPLLAERLTGFESSAAQKAGMLPDPGGQPPAGSTVRVGGDDGE